MQIKKAHVKETEAGRQAVGRVMSQRVACGTHMDPSKSIAGSHLPPSLLCRDLFLDDTCWFFKSAGK